MQDLIEHLLKVFTPGFFSVDNLKLGRKLGKSQIYVFEVHLDDLVKSFELTIPF